MAIQYKTKEEKRDEAAMAIIATYKNCIKKRDQTRSRAKKNICKLLQSVGAEKLVLAMTNYKNSGDMPAEEMYRYGVGNFYGRAAHWEYYAAMEEIPEDNGGCEWEGYFDELEG